MTQMVPSLQHGVLSKEFVELMGHCNTIQAQYRDRNVERIQRQLKISECAVVVTFLACLTFLRLSALPNKTHLISVALFSWE